MHVKTNFIESFKLFSFIYLKPFLFFSKCHIIILCIPIILVHTISLQISYSTYIILLLIIPNTQLEVPISK